MAMVEWLPVNLLPEVIDEICQRNQLQSSDCKPTNRSNVDKALSKLLAPVAAQLVDREGLPHIAHLICGWGNARVRGKALFDYIHDFVVLRDQKPLILQSDDAGDFHPWQTFAYCVMAGARHLEAKSGPLELATIASNCIDLNTNNNTDLGHFLYAVSNLRTEKRPESVIFDKRSIGLPEVFDVALDGHYYGGFEVCRKFHLTEGLCASSALLRRTDRNDTISEFVVGQLSSIDSILCISKILYTNINSPLNSLSSTDRYLLNYLREKFVLGDAIENIFYYAGHLIELAAIAISYKFQSAARFHNSIISTISFLDKILLSICNELEFSESFYAFAHYRRGILMYTDALGGREHRSIDVNTNLDHLEFDAYLREKKVHPFSFAPQKPSPSAYFQSILSAYNSSQSIEFHARGEFRHFRKIMPANLPTGVHFEFLDYGTSTGIELHCERPHLSDHSLFRELTVLLQSNGLSSAVFDPNWHHECGRVLAIFEASKPAGEIASTMCAMIDITIQTLATHYNSGRLKGHLGSRAQHT